jgi:ribonucleoside-diphosphate reductase alpha chain
MDLWVREARIFKYGSGVGTNFSKIRGSHEKLSGGGSSSAPPKFPGMGAGLSGIPGAGRPNINNTDDVDAMIANITNS